MKKTIFTLLLIGSIIGCKNANDQQGAQNNVDETSAIQSSENLTDSIQVKTIQVGSEGDEIKNRFHGSYPNTVYDFINKEEEKFIQTYYDEFKEVSKNHGEEAVSKVSFGQHFEVTEQSNRFLGFLIERYTSYGKHLPDLGSRLRNPEEADFELGCEVIVARSKLDGSLLGTLRTHANVLKPLPLQASIRLPALHQGQRMIETTRLCVKGNPNSSLVRNTLFKALFQYCSSQDVAWMMAAGRRPVDRIYDALIFSDVGEPGAFYPMAHAGNMPHRVMRFSPAHAQATWGACHHPLYEFVFETEHPDIDLTASSQLNFQWLCPESTTDRHPDSAPLTRLNMKTANGHVQANGDLQHATS